MAVKGDKPRDITREYPWGTKTKTYKSWLALFAINSILLSVLFLGLVEIPTLTGDDSLFRSVLNLNDPVMETPDGDRAALLLWCLAIIAANTALVWLTKTVGGWVSSLEEYCTEADCNWWCLCCNKWHCVFVWVIKWVTWVITWLATVITTALVWVCFKGVNPFG